MRFVIDMGLSQHLAHWLHELGHDAVHLVERSLQRATDLEILEIAQREDRIILTADTDFAQLAAELQINGPSIILFRLSSYKFSNVQGNLLSTLESFEPQLYQGCVISVNDRQARIRRLPILREI